MMSRQILVASASIVCLALSAFSLVANSAQANPVNVINVDFNVTDLAGGAGTYIGSAEAPGAGTSWNGVYTGTYTNPVTTFTSAALTASDGVTPTSVTVTLGNYASYDTAPGYALFDAVLLDDYVYDIHSNLPTSTSPATFSIDHLTPGGHYDLYVYSQDGVYYSVQDNFTVNGVTQSITNTGADASGFGLGDNYLLFSNVLATGGSISGDFVTTFGGPGAFNGFQLVQIVPEPSSMALSCLGLVGLAGVGRRRRQRAVDSVNEGATF